MNTKDNNIDTMIQNYVLGRLNDTDAAEFEEYFLSKPELIEQIETAQHMRAGLTEAQNIDLQTATNSEPSKINRRSGSKKRVAASLFEKLLNLVSIPVPAFAVAAMAAVMLPMALQNFDGQAPNSDISLINFSSLTTRSSEQGITIDLSNSVENSAIMIKLKTVEFPSYKLKLIPIEANDDTWLSPSFQVSALRDKLIILPELNHLGKVEIEVFGIDANKNEVNVDFCHYSETCN